MSSVSKTDANKRNDMIISKRINDATTISFCSYQTTIAQKAELMRSSRLRNIDDIVISKKLVQLLFRNALANIVCMLTLVRMISHDTSYSLQLKTLSTQGFSQNIVCNVP